jgi:hypothetical protein
MGIAANSSEFKSRQKRAKTAKIVRIAGYLTCSLTGGWLLFLTLNTAWPEYCGLRAENALLQGDSSEALKWVNLGQPHGSVRPALYRLSGLVYLEQRRKSDSPWDRLDYGQRTIQAFSSATSSAPQDWRNSLLLGNALAESGQMRLAEKWLLESIRLNSRQSIGYESYAHFLRQEARFEEADQAYLLAGLLPGFHSWDIIKEIQRRALSRANASKK